MRPTLLRMPAIVCRCMFAIPAHITLSLLHVCCGNRNVNGALCNDMPVRCDRQGVSLMSGFSPMLLNVFLQAPIASEATPDKPDPMSPLGIMMAAIGEYAVAVHESER